MHTNYAVIGNPITHSKSPDIHAAFARETGEAVRYGRILGEAATFAQQVREFFAHGGRGLNITVPFKELAWPLCDQRSPRAERAGAVNTLLLAADGTLHGENTDGIGLVRDLHHNHGCPLRGMRILLLGAGGAARGVIAPLLEAAPAQLTIANRTAEKAVTLAAAYRELGAVSGCGLEALTGERFDLVIHATAAGLGDQVPTLPAGVLVPGGWSYDLMYGDRPTAFVRWGEEQGAGHALDGLGMLVEQAAEAFWLWRGIRPQTAPVIAALRSGKAG